MYVEIVLNEMATLHQSDFSLSLAAIEMEVGEMHDRFQLSGAVNRGIPSLLRLYYMMPNFPGSDLRLCLFVLILVLAVHLH